MTPTELRPARKKELWLRLRYYQFNDLVPPHLSDKVLAAFGGADASTQAFASKLARKLGWSRAFALRAIAEYKKFVFLGITSDFSVTPPKIIDQVWHEHLLFSRAYRDFCRVVLTRDFDHHPELVPTDEQTEQFQAQYAATLEAYRTEFNRVPPADIWGKPKFKPTEREPNVELQRRGSDTGSGDFTSWDAGPLFASFSAADGDPGFGGGGGFSGGGSGGDFDGGDSGSSDGGGGDSGGGSGCSSSCGSGCGGGGD